MNENELIFIQNKDQSLVNIKNVKEYYTIDFRGYESTEFNIVFILLANKQRNKTEEIRKCIGGGVSGYRTIPGFCPIEILWSFDTPEERDTIFNKLNEVFVHKVGDNNEN